jgi:hypothetical protein
MLRDWKDIVPELTEEENRIVLIQFSNPSVIKFFQRLALDAMTDSVVKPILLDGVAKDDRTLIAEASYMKGKLEVVSTIIESVMEYQKTIQPKKTP